MRSSYCIFEGIDWYGWVFFWTSDGILLIYGEEKDG